MQKHKKESTDYEKFLRKNSIYSENTIVHFNGIQQIE